MKKLRIAFPLLVLLTLTAATPSYAVFCGICLSETLCSGEHGTGTICRFSVNTCTELSSNFCNNARPTDGLASSWTIASVETSTPAKHEVVTQTPRSAAVNTPAAQQQAR